jgi:hypothetical protein
VNYAFRFSGRDRPKGKGKGRDKGEVKDRLSSKATQLPSSVTLVNKLLTITRRNFSKANMSLSHLPPELLGLILANIFPDEWDRYDSGFKVLNLRIVCRKYSKCVFQSFRPIMRL